MTNKDADRRDAPGSHRYVPKVLRHRHVIGSITVCGVCERTAYECASRSAA